jgi:hypothetical protein
VQQTCNGFLDISYPQLAAVSCPSCTAPPGFTCTPAGCPTSCSCSVQPGTDVDLQIALGAGSILGGNNLQVFNFLTGLDCKRFLPLPTLPVVCAHNPDGPRVSFNPAAPVTTDCHSTGLGMTPPPVTTTPFVTWSVGPFPPPP